MTTGTKCVIIGRVRYERPFRDRRVLILRGVCAWVCGWLLIPFSMCGQAQDGSGEAGRAPVPGLSLRDASQAAETIAGPAWSDFGQTLDLGRRQEAVGPLYYAQQTGSEQSPTGAAKPVGTAAAPAEPVTGVAAARPAGAAIAPAKQRRARAILIRVSIVIGAAIAVGTVVALSRASPSRPN